MTVKLELAKRGNSLYVSGRVLWPGTDEPERVRKSTGYKVGQEAKAYGVLEAMKARYEEGLRLAGERARGGGGAVAPSSFSPAVGGGGFLTVADVLDVYVRTGPKLGATTAGLIKAARRAIGSHRLIGLEYVVLHNHFNRLSKTGKVRAANTVDRDVNAVKAAFNFARKIDRNVPDFEWVKNNQDDSRCRWLTKEEKRKFLDAFDDLAARDLATFLFGTGSRIGNAMDLRWRHVRLGEDAGASEVTLSTQKGKGKRYRERKIPMTREVFEVLKRRWHEGSRLEGDYVFRRSDGEVWGQRKNVYRHWNEACVRAGVEDFTPHDARHTFASHLVQGGVTLIAVRDLLGHTDMSMVERYAHLAPSHHREAMRALEHEVDEAGTRERSQFALKKVGGDVVLPAKTGVSGAIHPSGSWSHTPRLSGEGGVSWMGWGGVPSR